MAHLEWSDALNLDLPLMDDTHREFVELLAAVDQAADADLLPYWRTLVDDALRSGAIGVSTGLFYETAVAATTSAARSGPVRTLLCRLGEHLRNSLQMHPRHLYVHHFRYERTSTLADHFDIDGHGDKSTDG